MATEPSRLSDSSSLGCLLRSCVPGMTEVAPFSSLKSSQAQQKVVIILCSGNGAGSQLLSQCNAMPFAP